MLKHLFAIVLLFSASPGGAETDGRTPTDALEQGDTATAIQGYEDMLKTGLVNGHLYYNLGIAYFKAGRNGDAMAAFLAARRFLPRDPDVAANLRHVLTKVPDKLEAEIPHGANAPLAMLLDQVTTKELILALGILTGLAGLAVGFTWLRPALSPWRTWIWATTVLPAAIGGLLAAKLNRPEVWGAVEASPKAAVYSGPGEQNTLLFELSQGAPVLITDRGLSGFLKVQLSDGKTGWIAGSQVKVFGPQFGAL